MVISHHSFHSILEPHQASQQLFVVTWDDFLDIFGAAKDMHCGIIYFTHAFILFCQSHAPCERNPPHIFYIPFHLQPETPYNTVRIIMMHHNPSKWNDANSCELSPPAQFSLSQQLRLHKSVVCRKLVPNHCAQSTEADHISSDHIAHECVDECCCCLSLKYGHHGHENPLKGIATSFVDNDLVRKNKSIQLHGHRIGPWQSSELTPPPTYHNLVNQQYLFRCI